MKKKLDLISKNVSNHDFSSFLSDYKNTIEKYFPITNYEFKKIYVPILRGLRNPVDRGNQFFINNTKNEELFNDLYATRTLHDYKLKTEIFTGLTLYEDVKKLLLGTHEERDIIKKFEIFLSENFFNYENVTLIPKHDSDVIHVTIGNERDIPIYNLGDGIQSIIILTFPLFKNIGKKLLVFIEEPELFLHPGMQRILIETFLRKEFEQFQYFISTHSNHLLDLTLDLDDTNDQKDLISIFTSKKEKTDENKSFVIENVSSDDNVTLKLLGVRNSSIFLSNCTIWVEGITDRLYLRHYFDIYQKDEKNKDSNFRVYKEDLHFSFVEYSGGNITHWSFLDDENELEPTINVKKICNKIFLIADKDYEDESTKETEKKLRHEKLKNNLGITFEPLDCVEIENLIKENVLFEIIRELEGLDSTSNLKTKKDISKYSYEDYKNKRIGKFIDSNFLKKTTRKGNNSEGKKEEGFYKYAEKSGTIKDKKSFCKIAIKYTKNIQDLTSDSLTLCKSIYNFISKHN